MPATKGAYPLSRTKFRVEIDKMPELTSWVYVSGLRYGIETSEIYDDHTGLPRHLPGKRRAGPIVLKRMFDADDSLAKWANTQAKELKDGSVIFLDYTGDEARRFNWSKGYVSNYYLEDFDALPGSEGAALEVVEITVEDIFPG